MPNKLDRLVVEAKTNDAAFSQLAHNLDRLIGWAAYKWGPRCAQDQARQDALMGLWEAVKSYEPDGARAIFKTVAVAYMKNAVRGSNHPRAIDTITVGFDVHDVEHLVGEEDADIQHLLDRSEVETLLSLLDDDERQVVELHYGFNGLGPMSLVEASQELGHSPPWAQKRRLSAINKLRAEYDLPELGKLKGLTADQISEVKARHSQGTSLAQLGREYGVSHTSIGRYVGNNALPAPA